jgi:RNA polymerase sigma-70 factor (ECF subfamily)
MSCAALSPHDGLMPPRPPIAPAVEGSEAWTAALRGPATPAREDALARLHPLMLRATQFALSRQPDQLSGLGTADIDGLAVRAADDALMSNLRTLDDYRGASRFTTWASKFAVHEAGVKGRRSASQVREPLGEPADDEVEGTP